jgi:hypothetical protein
MDAVTAEDFVPTPQTFRAATRHIKRDETFLSEIQMWRATPKAVAVIAAYEKLFEEIVLRSARMFLTQKDQLICLDKAVRAMLSSNPHQPMLMSLYISNDSRTSWQAKKTPRLSMPLPLPPRTRDQAFHSQTSSWVTVK